MTPKFKSIPQHECQQENNHIFNVKTGKVLKLLKKICLNVKTYSTTFCTCTEKQINKAHENVYLKNQFYQ
jgi:hypothetical protein